MKKKNKKEAPLEDTKEETSSQGDEREETDAESTDAVSEDEKKNEPEPLKLPQNIVPVGETVNGEGKIYILQSVYKEIHRFASDKTSVECGGVLLGEHSEQFGTQNIVISAFIEAKYSKGTPTSLTFTHQSWDYIHKIQDKKYPSLKIVGWIHTHPNYDVFLSEYDRFIVDNFFSEPFQTAYVVDPVKHTEGFFLNTGGGTQRAGGFYIYDKAGEKIKLAPDKPLEEEKIEPAAAPQTSVKFVIMCVISGILALICAFVLVRYFGLSRELESTEDRLSRLEQQCSELYQNDVRLKGFTQEIADKIEKIEKAQPQQSTEQTEASQPDEGNEEQSEAVPEDSEK